MTPRFYPAPEDRGLARGHITLRVFGAGCSPRRGVTRSIMALAVGLHFLHLLQALIWFYQKAISLDHSLWRNLRRAPACKFYPTCSQYAKEALEKHGIIKGTILIARRLLRCNPWSSGGVDQP